MKISNAECADTYGATIVDSTLCANWYNVYGQVYAKVTAVGPFWPEWSHLQRNRSKEDVKVVFRKDSLVSLCSGPGLRTLYLRFKSFGNV